MNVGRVARVLINKLGHLKITLGDVMGNIDRLPRRQRPVLQVLLPSSRFQDSRAILGQVDRIYAVVDGVKCERRGT